MEEKERYGVISNKKNFIEIQFFYRFQRLSIYWKIHRIILHPAALQAPPKTPLSPAHYADEWQRKTPI